MYDVVQVLSFGSAAHALEAHDLTDIVEEGRRLRE
jgi:hypothetical protein